MNWSEFRKAVKDSPEPTPGYLYNTLSQWTYADRNTQNQLVNALFDKLHPALSGPPTSVHVLYKVIHLIKVLSETGHPDFQKEVQTAGRSATLRNYASYHGRADPMHGDALNERIRCEARAALEVAFNDRGSRPGDFTGCGGGDGLSAASAPAASSSGFGFLRGDVQGFGNSGLVPAGGGDQGKFRTGERVAGVGSGHNGLSSSSSAFQPVGRVAEMPQENRWMDYIADAEARRTTQPANTLMHQLSSKAKAGWNLVREHERMKLKEDRIYTPSTAASSSGAARVPAHTAVLLDPTETRASSYQPVGVPIAQVGEEHERVETEERQQSAGAKSRFAFVNESAAASEPEEEVVDVDVPHRRASGSQRQPSQQQQQQPFRRLVQRLASAKVAPQRVELADFFDACLAEGERRLASSLDNPHPLHEQQQQQQQSHQAAFSFLDGVGEAVTQPSRSNATGSSGGSDGWSHANVVWTALAEALDEQLSPQQPWQHRLNALSGLEALLHRCGSGEAQAATQTAAAAATDSLFNESGIAQAAQQQQHVTLEAACGGALRMYFGAKPEGIARNAHVAQSTLSDKAARVASLLAISTNQPAPAVRPTAPSSTAAAAAAAEPLTMDGLAMGGARRRHKQHQQQQQPVQSGEMKDLFGLATPSAASAAGEAKGHAPAAPSSLFTADDGTALKPRRRVPLSAGAAATAPTPAPPASVGGAPPPAPSANSTALDDLFGPPSASPAATAIPAHPQAPPSGIGELFSGSSPAQQQQMAGRPAISVLGIHSYPTGGLVDPLVGLEPQPQLQPQVHYNSYGSGYAVPVAEGSSHFTTGGVASTAAAPGSVQSMNKAFAEMQRKLMSDPH